MSLATRLDAVVKAIAADIKALQNGSGSSNPPPGPREINFNSAFTAAPWTNQPAALTELNAGNRSRVKVDLTGYEQARMTVALTTAGTTTAQLRFQYATDGDTQATWAYLDGVDGPKVGLQSPLGGKVSPWTTITPAARADVWIRVVGINGDAALDPSFGQISLQVKPVASAPLTIESIPGLRGYIDDFEARIMALENGAPPQISGYLTTWTEVLAKANTDVPVVIAHRGGGAEVTMDSVLSAIDYSIAVGPGDKVVIDGGDIHLTSDGVMVVSHDATTAGYYNGDMTIATSTYAQLQTLNALDFPYHRGTVSTEKMPTARQWLEKCKALGIFSTPETKVTAAAQPLANLIVELGMQQMCQVQAFASTAQEADDRLGPAKTAGISVGLLQSAARNIGFPAITTCINGGPPDVVLYNPVDTGTFTDAWIQSAITAGIKLQMGTISRRHTLAEQKARVAALGGKLTLIPSDNPFYLSDRMPLRTTSAHWANTWTDHGIIPSSSSSREPRIIPASAALAFDDGLSAQHALMGAFTGPTPWKTLELEIRYRILDTNYGRFFGIFWGMANDKEYHDGVTTGDGNNLAFLIRQDGAMRLYKRVGNVSTNTASTIVGNTTPGTESAEGHTAFSAGNTRRYLIENLTDAGGNFTSQCRVTEMGSGQWILTAPGDAPLFGPYWHMGKNGATNMTIEVDDLILTY